MLLHVVKDKMETFISTRKKRGKRLNDIFQVIVLNLPLFLSDENIDGCPGKVPAFPDFVFEEPSVRLFDILRKVSVENK